MMLTNRRRFLLFAAPAIVAAPSLMRLSVAAIEPAYTLIFPNAPGHFMGLAEPSFTAAQGSLYFCGWNSTMYVNSGGTADWVKIASAENV